MKSPKAKASDFCTYGFLLHASVGHACQRQDQRRFVRFAAEFISFDERQKKRTKEKRFVSTANPAIR